MKRRKRGCGNVDKFTKCHLGLAGTLLLGIAVIAVAGMKKSGLAAVLAFLVMGLLGSVLAAQYKMETYRVIGEKSPGAYERILKEGEFQVAGRPPLPGDVEELLRKNRRFQHRAAWLPILEMVLFFVMQMILKEA